MDRLIDRVTNKSNIITSPLIASEGRETILRNKPIIFIENLHYGYPNVCPDPNPHQTILNELNYTKIQSNILGSFMDLWVSK